MTIKTLAASAGAIALMTGPTLAEVDLSGKTVEWVIPFSETGGSAKWANFLHHFCPRNCQAIPRLW